MRDDLGRGPVVSVCPRLIDSPHTVRAARLWKTLECWQAHAGLGHSPRTLLEELARIHAHDVILPTPELGEVRLRCITQPDSAQAALLDRLGLVLPKRIRLPEIAVATPTTRTVA